MTRDETVALFEACEAKRRDARAAALRDNKSECESREIAHQAAKSHWNAWAQSVMADQERPLKSRRWQNMASADFSRCLFLGTHPKETATLKTQTGKKEQAEEPGGDIEVPICSIQLESNRAEFSGFVFPGETLFRRATFDAEAEFDGAEFNANAWYDNTVFHGTAWFRDSVFLKDARFTRSTFKGDALFRRVVFHSEARFSESSFHADAWFYSATFQGDASFHGVTVEADARLENAKFGGWAWFRGATFVRRATLDGASFQGPAHFGRVRFKGNVSFALASFERYATFRNSSFNGPANFSAIRSGSAFDMGDATFDVVPDFNQAHFDEVPRFDNLKILDQIKYRLAIVPDRDIPSRWRALKRLAIQGQDTERELEFHACELRSQRFAGDWPAPWPVWRGKAWGGFFRFWSGCLYEWFSDFGRSLARPLIASWLVLFAAAAFYLSQTEAVQRDLALQDASYLSATAQTARYALSNEVPCYRPAQTAAEIWRGRWPWWRKAAAADPRPSPLKGLPEAVAGMTNARAEALHLAFRNAALVLDGGAEASRRIYGCLYGLEPEGPAHPVVPPAISTVSAIQKLFSAVTIFLFGLALRNMLKMK